MLKWNETGKLIVTDEEKLNKKLSFKFKHFNHLPLNNIYVQQAINKFGSQYGSRYVFQKLKVFYWMQCDTLLIFEQEIKQRLDQDLKFEKFVA